MNKKHEGGAPFFSLFIPFIVHLLDLYFTFRNGNFGGTDVIRGQERPRT